MDVGAVGYAEIFVTLQIGNKLKSECGNQVYICDRRRCVIVGEGHYISVIGVFAESSRLSGDNSEI